MRKSKIGNWEIEFDKSLTEKVYKILNTVEKGCSCQTCKNFSKASILFPEEVISFFQELGIDHTKPTEAYEIEYKNGFVRYGGFYHIVGNYISGSDIWQPKKKIFRTKDVKYFKIIDNYEIGFTKMIAFVPDDFPKPILQMEINFLIPWVLNEDYDDSSITKKEF